MRLTKRQLLLIFFMYIHCSFSLIGQFAVTISPVEAVLLACESTPITLTALIDNQTAEPPFTFEWAGPGIIGPTNTQTIMALPPLSGTPSEFTVTVTDSSPYEPITIESAPRLVTTLPSPTVDITGQTRVNAGDALNLAADAVGGAGGPFTFSWTGPQNFSADTQQITIPNIQQASTGTFTVTARDTSGCQGQATVSVTVEAPVAVLTVEITARETMCSRSPVDYFITVTNIGATGATNVVLTDILPHCLVFLDTIGNDWTVSSASGQTITATNTFIPAGGKSFLTLRTRGNNCAPGTTNINTISVKADNAPQVNATFSTAVQINPYGMNPTTSPVKSWWQVR